MRAYTRYTVRRIATIRPIQFSALKVLNPLDDEDEHGEDDDRQADVKQIRHHKLLWKGMCYGPIKNLVRGGLSRPDDSYAAERWFLTDPMRGRHRLLLLGLLLDLEHEHAPPAQRPRPWHPAVPQLRHERRRRHGENGAIG